MFRAAEKLTVPVLEELKDLTSLGRCLTCQRKICVKNIKKPMISSMLHPENNSFEEKRPPNQTGT